MSGGPEWELVEEPLLRQLESLGWETIVWGQHSADDQLDRASERDVLLERRFATALFNINLGTSDSTTWLDSARVKAAIAELKAVAHGTRLLEANQQSTELLLSGVSVPGLPDWDGGRDQTIDFIDGNNWAANDFLAISQFPVMRPGTSDRIKPDVILFVNGIPLVVIEAKAPDKEITAAIEQLRRYANQRDSEVPEGAEKLFWTNQFTVATTGERAEAGTFTSLPEHYLAWKDPHPLTVDELAGTLGKPADQVTQQEMLVAGMLAPERLLDIVRHFTTFVTLDSGNAVKVVCRYQQYRGVHKAMTRMLTGKTRAEDGNVDRRGGIIWHTQGSGKSLTMVFLIRAMRSHPDLRHFKIVLVTDRTDLQRQLGDTAQLTGETVKVAKDANQLKDLLRQPGAGLVMAMIQKYRDTDLDTGDGMSNDAVFETLNDSPSVLVMVDEAHRSHGSALHANLMNALPNAARIGFTGTPIIMGKRKQTLEIFGGYLDRYTLIESEADGSTVPIRYEGRTTDSAVKGASAMDELFFEWFGELPDEKRNTLQTKYATVAQVLEAPEVIAAKARDILRHYVSTVMPDGFKAMLVATSREACVRYYDALVTARKQLVAEVEGSIDRISTKAENDVDSLTPKERFLFDASKRLDLIEDLGFSPIISAGQNDPASYGPWTDATSNAGEARQTVRIDNFKKKLGPADDKHDPLAILIVKSMLLTGFDAPNAQVLYLDRLIQQAELLQAIARVNRTAPRKSYGLIVDYYGVSSHLAAALAAYTADDGLLDDDVDRALLPLTAEIDKLQPQSERVRQIFVQRGVQPGFGKDEIDACVLLLGDERLRAEFDVALDRFLDTLDMVLPRPQASPFVGPAKLFGTIQVQTRLHYRDTADGDFDPRKYKDKVRALVDEHITVLDLAQKIAPIRITDVDFSAQISQVTSARTKASEMEHAIRHHIREHHNEDPAYYQKLSDRIDEILDKLGEKWDQLVLAFEDVVAEVRTGPTDADDTGLDPATELPFRNQLADSVSSSAPDSSDRLNALTRAVVEQVRNDIAVVGFWENPVKQDQMRKELKGLLDDSDLFTFEELDALAVSLVDVAKHNSHKLVER